MGSINLKHTGSGSDIALSSDGTSLLLNGEAVGGGSANAVATTTVPVAGQTNNGTIAIGNDVLTAVDDNKHYNTAIGDNAMELATDSRSTVAVGSFALKSNGTASFGWQNTAIGASAGLNVTGGYSQIFMGYLCGGAIAGGTGNTVIGAEAYKDKTGSDFQDNVVLGYKAGWGSTPTSPHGQVLIGTRAGSSSASGIIAIGDYAAYAGTGGSNSIALGQRALARSGNIRNIAIGQYALLEADITAQENTAVGYYALKELTSGDKNVAVGNQAIENVTTGSYNTCVGDSAGINQTTPSSNTFIGRYSGGTVTTGSNNTILGRFNGNYGGLDIRTSDNNIVLADGSGNPRIYVNSSGDVMVGKTVTTQSTPGTVLYSSGQIYNTASGTHPLVLTRNTNDGALSLFYKDTNEVGRIAANGGSIIVGSGNTGLYFDDGSDRLIPVDPVSASGRDDAINLGGGSERFKDLYLSGGVYLGGTALANKLDDYEQSTFTPEFYYGSWGYSVQRGDIIRIGNLVQVSMMIAWSSSSATSDVLSVQLPIQSIAVTTARFSGCLGYVSGFDTTTDYKQINPVMSGNSTFINFYRMNDNTAPTYLTNSSCSGSGEVQIAIAFTAA